ncbi:MAG: Ig-like domain-containing protein [Lachnospiraceae bacterium]|nr:Ig-like domain-containing protein [Lachnospiraceae bacterium]
MKKLGIKFRRRLATLLVAVLMTGLLPTVTYASASNEKALETAYNSTKTYVGNILKNTHSDDLLGSEWFILGHLRSDYSKDIDLGSEYFQVLFRHVDITVKEQMLPWRNPTDYARVIICLSSFGYDPTDVAGYDLIKALSDYKYITNGTLNCATWALLAFDSGNDTGKYTPVPNSRNGRNVTRDKLIQHILDNKITGGGWNLHKASYGNAVDPDITAMTIQALAPYYNKRTDVKTAVDEALNKLSEMQDKNTAGYVTYYGEQKNDSSETIDQVIVALASLGIDPEKDSRFIKNGKSLLDSLLRFAVSGGGFKHNPDDTGVNGLATAQSFYALTAYYRMRNGRSFLYDMSDVSVEENPLKVDKAINAVYPEGPDDPVDPVSTATIKKVKFKKNSYTMTYSKATDSYSNAPLNLLGQIRLQTSEQKSVTPPVNGMTIKWSVAKGSNLITVDPETGEVNPKKDANGTAKVKVTVKDSKGNSKTATTTINIKGPTKVNSVKVKSGKKTSGKVEVEKSINLTVTVGPSNAKNHNVTWSVDKKGKKLVDIEVIDEKTLKVTAKKQGTAKITATAADGSKKKGTFTLKITPKAVSSITLNETELSLAKGDTFKLIPSILPEGADTNVTWKSSKSSIVSVDKKGKIKVKKTSDKPVTITVTSKSNKKKKATCKVTVVDERRIVIDPTPIENT